MAKEEKEWQEKEAAQQQARPLSEAAAAAEAEATSEQRAFLQTEAALTLEAEAPLKKTQGPQTPEEFRQSLQQPTYTTKEEARAKNFWVPENTPDEPASKLKEPQRRGRSPLFCVWRSLCLVCRCLLFRSLCCPISGAPLRLKQLVKVKPEYASNEDTETTRWLCALSRREISHQKAAVVKATGQVVLLEYLEKLVFGKKGALTSGVIDKKDVVPLVPGGTGFSAHNKVEVAVARPNVQ
ncbi:hypothetical protein Efla_006914 [Eimeria flavescens]